MSAQNAKREKELIEQIKKLRCDQSALDNDYQGCEDCCKMIANWHLAEVKRIVEPLYESESIILHNQSDDKNHYSANQERKFGIAKALKRANGGE